MTYLKRELKSFDLDDLVITANYLDGAVDNFEVSKDGELLFDFSEESQLEDLYDILGDILNKKKPGLTLQPGTYPNVPGVYPSPNTQPWQQPLVTSQYAGDTSGMYAPGTK